MSGRPWGITSAFALWGAKAASLIGFDTASWPYWSSKANAAALSAPLEGDDSIEITRISEPASASGRSDLALAMTPDSVAALALTKARAVIVGAKGAAALDRFDAVIKVERPRETLAVLTRLFEQPIHRGSGIHPSAVIAPDAQIGDGAVLQFDQDKFTAAYNAVPRSSQIEYLSPL